MTNKELVSQLKTLDIESQKVLTCLNEHESSCFWHLEDLYFERWGEWKNHFLLGVKESWYDIYPED